MLHHTTFFSLQKYASRCTPLRMFLPVAMPLIMLFGLFALFVSPYAGAQESTLMFLPADQLPRKQNNNQKSNPNNNQNNNQTSGLPAQQPGLGSGAPAAPAPNASDTPSANAPPLVLGGGAPAASGAGWFENFRSTFSIFAGVGDVYYFYQATNTNSKTDINGSQNSIGLAFGLRTAQNLYKPGMLGLGYFLSTRVVVGVYSMDAVSRLNNAPRGATKSTVKLYAVPSKKVVKTISHNVNAGVNVFFKTQNVLYSIGVGPSFNVLYYDIGAQDTAASTQDEANSYLITLGIGLTAEFGLAIKVNPYIAVPLDLFVSYYPFNFEGRHSSVRYNMQGVVSAGLSSGVSFYY